MSRRLAVTLLLILFVSPLMAKSYTPRWKTRAGVKAYVNRAAKVVVKKGPACDTFKDPSWTSKDWYIFVFDADGKTLCHQNPEVIGKMASELVDANGKKFGDELIAAGKKPGGAWVHYVWPRPGGTTPVPKSSYAEGVTGPDGKMYVVGSGGYGLK